MIIKHFHSYQCILLPVSFTLVHSFNLLSWLRCSMTWSLFLWSTCKDGMALNTTCAFEFWLNQKDRKHYHQIIGSVDDVCCFLPYSYLLTHHSSTQELNYTSRLTLLISNILSTLYQFIPLIKHVYRFCSICVSVLIPSVVLVFLLLMPYQLIDSKIFSPDDMRVTSLDSFSLYLFIHSLE